jgi:hypothetical protein
MTRLPHRVVIASLGVCAAVSALSVPEARRAFLKRMPIAAASVATATFLHHGYQCSCGNCGLAASANAYERRDVGGEDASAITKAMNLQAYETNDRLEREGLKMEVRMNDLSLLLYSIRVTACSARQLSNVRRLVS